jgi:hypothetical protein
MNQQLTKMRAQDLIGVLMEYCTAPEDMENTAWRAWNSAWEQADDMCRRDALMIAGTYLTEARRELQRISDGA